jgi:hypothetical protein
MITYFVRTYILVTTRNYYYVLRILFDCPETGTSPLSPFMTAVLLHLPVFHKGRKHREQSSAAGSSDTGLT